MTMISRDTVLDAYGFPPGLQEECARSEKLRSALEPFATKDIPSSPLALALTPTLEPLELEPRQQSFVPPL
jgi:hypothetical protein